MMLLLQFLTSSIDDSLHNMIDRIGPYTLPAGIQQILNPNLPHLEGDLLSHTINRINAFYLNCFFALETGTLNVKRPLPETIFLDAYCTTLDDLLPLNAEQIKKYQTLMSKIVALQEISVQLKIASYLYNTDISSLFLYGTETNMVRKKLASILYVATKNQRLVGNGLEKLLDCFKQEHLNYLEQQLSCLEKKAL